MHQDVSCEVYAMKVHCGRCCYTDRSFVVIQRGRYVDKLKGYKEAKEWVAKEIHMKVVKGGICSRCDVYLDTPPPSQHNNPSQQKMSVHIIISYPQCHLSD